MKENWPFALLSIALLRSLLISVGEASDSSRVTTLADGVSGILGMLIVGLGGLGGGIGAIRIGQRLMGLWKFAPTFVLFRLVKSAACFLIGGIAGGTYGGGLAGLALGLGSAFAVLIFSLFGMVYGAFSGSVMGFAYGVLRGGLGEDPPSGSVLILWIIVAMSVSGYGFSLTSWFFDSASGDDWQSLSVKILLVSVLVLLPACALKSIILRRGQERLP